MALIPLNTFKTKTVVLTTAEYNNETCARDTGLIVDSVAFDLLYGYDLESGNATQSVFSGLQYWAQNAIKIPGDVLQTLAALDRAREISLQIIRNDPVVFSQGYAGPVQVFDVANPDSPSMTGRRKIVAEYDLISRIIENGTLGVTDMIVPNGLDVTAVAVDWTQETAYDFGTVVSVTQGAITSYYRVVLAGTSGALPPDIPLDPSQPVLDGDAELEYIEIDQGAYNSAQLLLDNKEMIVEEVTTYVRNTFNKTLYDKPKFITNARLVVDSLAFDLLFDGSSQSKFAGLQYWTKDVVSSIPVDQLAPTIASIQRIKQIVLEIVRNQKVTVSPGNLLDQFTDTLTPGNAASITAVTYLFDTIIDILTNGTDVDIVANTQLTTLNGLLNAYTLIRENRQFIQQEIVAWIDNQISQASDPFDEFTFSDASQREKCYRDTGYIVDCVSFDLAYTSTVQANRQSVQAGVYYYNKTNVSLITPTEQSQTVTAFNYLKTLIDSVVNGRAIAVTYQSNIKQLTSLPAASGFQTTHVLSNFDMITEIIEKGPDIVDQVEPISLTPSTDVNDLDGFRLLLANREFLVAEAVAFLDNTTSHNFVLDGDRLDLCKRDMGYIVDCMVFDLRHLGNRQIVQAGVYYYDHSAQVSVIPRERVDTTEAFDYMKQVIGSVLNNTRPVQTYQSKVKQFTNLAPVVNVNTIVLRSAELVETVNSIIRSGPLEALVGTNKQPIGLAVSVDQDAVNAANILLANRAYIIAETVGFLNTRLLTRPNTTKIYTAPPGVTAIILMAQAANVIESSVNVTFAHYRNIPVFADPATYNGYQAANTVTELVKNFAIPPNNAANLIDGKMIVESFDSIIAYANVNEGVKITLSILETANA